MNVRVIARTLRQRISAIEILLSHSKKMLVSACVFFTLLSPAFSQSVTVSGKVTDSLGAGLSNVTVTEKGTKKSTLTNAEGNFSMAINSSASVLVFSSVGYQPREVIAGNQTNFMITLQATDASME